MFKHATRSHARPHTRDADNIFRKSFRTSSFGDCSGPDGNRSRTSGNNPYHPESARPGIE